jgi:hypothetical protein
MKTLEVIDIHLTHIGPFMPGGFIAFPCRLLATCGRGHRFLIEKR